MGVNWFQTAGPFKNSFLLYVFPLPFILLIQYSTSTHPSPHSHHSVLHIRESLFLFAQSPTPHPTALTQLFESVSILLISSVCSLDTHMSEFIFLMTNDIEHLFIGSLDICNFIGKNSTHIFCSFLNCVIFLIIELQNFTYSRQKVYQIYDFQVFSPILWAAF